MSEQSVLDELNLELLNEENYNYFPHQEVTKPMIIILKIIEKIKDMKIITESLNDIKKKYSEFFTTIDNTDIIKTIFQVLIKCRNNHQLSNVTTSTTKDGQRDTTDLKQQWERYVPLFLDTRKLVEERDNKLFFIYFDFLLHLIYYKGINILEEFNKHKEEKMEHFNGDDLMYLALAYKHVVHNIYSFDKYIIDKKFCYTTLEYDCQLERRALVFEKLKKIHKLCATEKTYINHTKILFNKYWIPSYLFENNLWKFRSSFFVKESLKIAPEYENECIMQETYNTMYDNISCTKILEYTKKLIDEHKNDFETILTIIGDFIYFFEKLKKINNFKKRYVHFSVLELKKRKTYCDMIPRIIDISGFGDFCLFYSNILYKGDIYSIMQRWYELVGKNFNHRIDEKLTFDITEDFC